MTKTWESICAQFRSILGSLVSETNAGRFLINLHPFYHALQEPRPFLTAEAVAESDYQRFLAKLLGREIGKLIHISESDPDKCPASWRKALHQDALADRHGLFDIVADYFNVVLFSNRTFPLAATAASRPENPIVYANVDAAIRKLEEFEAGTLWELQRSWPTRTQKRAVTEAFRMHLWASAAKDEAALADLEPVLPFLITAPPIGSDKTEPDNYLVLVR
jgi:hypothetical protein